MPYTSRPLRFPYHLCVLSAFALALTANAHARTADPLLPTDAPPSTAPTDELPEAPAAQNTPAANTTGPENPSHNHPPQTKRILGFIPNFRAVNADVELPAQSSREKFKTSLQDSFDYSAFLFVGVQAGANMASDSTPQFHQGAAGYARYYWHTFADQADENIWVEGILPSLLHQDIRYYTLGHGNFFRRAGYSVSRIVVTRTDSGDETFNTSEILGAGNAAAISALYYPVDDRTWTKVGQRWLTNITLDAAFFAVKEFWPDINSVVFHQK